MVEEEKKALTAQRNWADEDDDGDDEDVAIGGTIATPKPVQAPAAQQSAEDSKEAATENTAAE